MSLNNASQIIEALKQAAEIMKPIVEATTGLTKLVQGAAPPSSPQGGSSQPSASGPNHPAATKVAQVRERIDDARTTLKNARSSFGTLVLQMGPGKSGEDLEDAYERAETIIRKVTGRLDDLERAIIKEALAAQRDAPAAEQRKARQTLDAAIEALRGAEDQLARAEQLARKPLAPRNRLS